MFFAVAKFVLDDQGQEDREIHALVKKIQARFPVCVKTHERGFVVATLGERETSVSKQLDEIAAFAESVGIGRVESEDVMLDHIDNLSE